MAVTLRMSVWSTAGSLSVRGGARTEQACRQVNFPVRRQPTKESLSRVARPGHSEYQGQLQQRNRPISILRPMITSGFSVYCVDEEKDANGDCIYLNSVTQVQEAFEVCKSVCRSGYLSHISWLRRHISTWHVWAVHTLCHWVWHTI